MEVGRCSLEVTVGVVRFKWVWLELRVSVIRSQGGCGF